MIFYLNLRSQVVTTMVGAELVLIIMGMWDMLMISNCYVQVLKAYKECICNTFSSSNCFIFNATKTMCIQYHCGKHSGEIPQYPVYLGLDKLQWYSQVKHLGHIFNCCSSFLADVANRKGQFIGCVNSIISQFCFGRPGCKMKLLVTHGYSFMGLLYVTSNI